MFVILVYKGCIDINVKFEEVSLKNFFYEQRMMSSVFGGEVNIGNLFYEYRMISSVFVGEVNIENFFYE